jgi:hypothetical protein
MHIGLQTSDDKYFINHPEAQHKGFKASTKTHYPILYPYENGAYNGTHKPYGRIQGLNQLGVKKIAIPLMYIGKLEPVLLDEDVIVYSGFYVLGDLEEAMSMFNSDGFQTHILNNAEPKLGGWYSVSKEVMMSYEQFKEV